MHTQEARIYFALLIGLSVLVLLMACLLTFIIRYQREKLTYDRASIRKQLLFLEREKERIAYDLHDDLGALMSSLKMRLQLVVASGPDMEEKLSMIEREVHAIMQKMRGISHNMMPTVLKRKGLPEAVQNLIEHLFTDNKVNVSLEARSFRADPEVESHLYRIIQEMLNNIVRHACASNVTIKLLQENNTIKLDVQDDGVGFDEERIINEARGAGLRNIMVRVAIIGAKIYLKTKPFCGVQYQLNCKAYANFKD